jgi:putative peptidoglycan lipid II flippase
MTIPLIPSILNYESRTVESGALVIAIASAIGALLGIFRNGILASKFGASVELDAYFAAFRIPDLLYSILVFGAITAGFMPVFNKWLSEGKERGWELASAVMNVLAVILGVFAVLVAIFARELVAIFAPGFRGDDAELVASLLRIMMIQPIFLAASSVAAASMQSFRRFFVSALAPVFYNLGIIAGALWLVEVWGMPGLAYGVVLGAALHLAVQMPALFSLGFKWSPGIFRAWSGIRDIFALMIPRMANLGVMQLNLFAITAIASILPAGTLTIYNFSADLAGFPQIVFGLSFATAVFPSLTRLWAEKRVDEYRATVARTLSEMWFWVVAVSLVALALREPLVRLTLVFGAFGEVEYIRAVNTLTIFLLALAGQAGVVLLIRAFFAMGNTTTPLIAALLGSIVTIAVSFWFGRVFGAAGLALGPALAGFLQSAILLIALRRAVGGLDEGRIFEALRNGLVLGFAAGGVGWLAFLLLEHYIPGQEFSVVLVKFLIAAAAALATFMVGFFVIRVAKVSQARL